MERAFKIGCRVVFFDSHRQPHEALVTNWFHGGPDGQTVEEYQEKSRDQPYFSPNSLPCCNIVYVTASTDKKDPYGHQLERSTSVSYGRNQGMVPFVGYCWAWPDEAEEAKRLAAESFDKAVAK